MLPQTREQRRAVILDPKVPFRLCELSQSPFAVFEGVGRHEVSVVVPFAIAATDWGAGDAAFREDTQEEVDSGLLVSV